MLWLWIVAIVIVVGLIAFVFYRRYRKRRESRLIAIVALTRDHVILDPTVLATIAGNAWRADLGDGTNEGADGFVVGVGVMNTIQHHDRMFLINSIPNTYVPDVDAVADTIPDVRTAALFREHRAWISCDAMGPDGSTAEEEIKEWYRRLGRLLADLLDDNCLLIFLPDRALAFPVNDEMKLALRSRDPIATLQRTLSAPIIEISDNDPEMKQAVETARRRWPEFVTAFEQGKGENFSVKAPVTSGKVTEFIWICVTSFEGDNLYGELGNDPGDLGPLKLGSKVSVRIADLNDWCFIDLKGQLQGGFTIKVIEKAARRKQ